MKTNMLYKTIELNLFNFIVNLLIFSVVVHVSCSVSRFAGYGIFLKNRIYFSSIFLASNLTFLA